MKKNVFKGMGVCLLGLVLSCLLSLLVTMITVRIADMIFPIEGFAEIVIRAVASLLTVSATFGAVSYFVSYRMVSFDAAGSAARLGGALVIQLAISLLLKFEPFVAGGVKYLAAIFEFGSDVRMTADADMIGLIDYLSAFVIFSAIYMAVYIGAGIIGKKKRLSDRETILNEDKK